MREIYTRYGRDMREIWARYRDGLGRVLLEECSQAGVRLRRVRDRDRVRVRVRVGVRVRG